MKYESLDELWEDENLVGESGLPYRRLRKAGGYRELKSFQITTLIYDLTVRFCGQWVDRFSRTTDQMVQAARSGRQNIAEGSRAGATSASSELHLTNVARSSLEELLLDFEDYLRQHDLPQWEKEDEQAQTVRNLSAEVEKVERSLRGQSHRKRDDARMRVYADWGKSDDVSVVANTVICLIHQANYLLDQHGTTLERAVIEKGGYREQLTAARLAYRDQAEPKGPACPECGAEMGKRHARKGAFAGKAFWGCTRYPECRGIREVEEG
ncbi:four helix bundle suffix domain-containing protein [Kiritimatiellaeota bacterium B1221]|nr:four helix bundle suffix domain-containing protein [Kiritimatiellaeota bacterium B1221]